MVLPRTLDNFWKSHKGELEWLGWWLHGFFAAGLWVSPICKTPSKHSNQWLSTPPPAGEMNWEMLQVSKGSVCLEKPKELCVPNLWPQVTPWLRSWDLALNNSSFIERKNLIQRENLHCFAKYLEELTIYKLLIYLNAYFFKKMKNFSKRPFHTKDTEMLYVLFVCLKLKKNLALFT